MEKTKEINVNIVDTNLPTGAVMKIHFQNPYLFPALFSLNPTCSAESIITYLSSRHPGWLGIDWVEALMAGVKGGLMVMVILSCIWAFKKIFKIK